MRTKKGTFSFECGGLEFKGDSVTKTVSVYLKDTDTNVLDIDDVICLLDKLKNTLSEFEQVDDPEVFYCDQMYTYEFTTEQLITMSNDICNTNYRKRTDDFIKTYYKYGKVSMKKFVDNLFEDCYNADSIEPLFNCDYINIIKDNRTSSGEYICTYYDDAFFREDLTESIIKVLVNFDEEQLNDFNKKYSLHLKHYNEYLEENDYERG